MATRDSDKLHGRTGTALALLLAVGTAGALAAPDAARQAELIHLLRQDCGACHGMTLRGGLGPALLPETLAGKDPALLIATVLEGRPGTPMPPWAPFLTREEAAWLVQILREGVRDEP